MTEQLKDNNEIKKDKQRSYLKPILATVAIVAAATACGVGIYYEFYGKPKQNNQPTTVETDAPATVDQEQTPAPRCAETWGMTGEGHNENGDWVDGGIDKRNENGEKQDPRQVLSDWLDKVDADNSTLDYLAEAVHKAAGNKIVSIDATKLVDSDGCATELAVSEVEYINGVLASASVKYGMAPANGISSIVDEHNEVHRSAVSGDLESIVIDLNNGNKLFVQLSCGNLILVRVISQPAPVITSESKDKDHEKDHKKNKKIESKKPNENSSNKRNTKTGSGSNENQGSGDLQSASDVTKPSGEARVNPSAPSN